jgi:hypothetical protein
MFMDFDTFGLPYTFPNPPRLFDSRGGKHPGHPHAGSFFALVGAESQPERYEVCCPCGFIRKPGGIDFTSLFLRWSLLGTPAWSP